MSEDARIGPVARRLAATQRVLCVEDEPDVAGFLRAYFRASGYDLVHIDPRSPDEVLEALAEHEPDCVLLDIRLRGFSGMEAYRAMRADERWAFVPVVMVSAHAASDPTFETPAGLDAFVAKPFNTNALADLVRERIDQAASLADRGTNEALQVLSEDYLRARLADEIAVTEHGTVAFALVRLRSAEDVVAEVGTEGRDHLLRTVAASLRSLLPDDAVLGASDGSELAVVLPGTTARQAHGLLRTVLADVDDSFRFAGGAEVPVALSAGVAGSPDHASDADELFMAADAALADAIDADAALQLAR